MNWYEVENEVPDVEYEMFNFHFDPAIPDIIRCLAYLAILVVPPTLSTIRAKRMIKNAKRRVSENERDVK